MNYGHREDNSCCCFHPKEIVVGVCAKCLHERLLILAAKQGHHLPSSVATTTHGSRKPSISLPKIFALGSLLNRLEFDCRWRSDDNSNKSDASTSPEESFISIKFEDNGAALWEKGSVSNKATLDHYCTKSSKNDKNPINFITTTTATREAKQEQAKDIKETMSVIEHAKPRGSLRWRKRIGHLFQLVRGKRSNRANVCHVGTKVEGVKVMRKGWIRTLTKRRTKE